MVSEQQLDLLHGGKPTKLMETMDLFQIESNSLNNNELLA